jgi:hypothetical protein
MEEQQQQQQLKHLLVRFFDCVAIPMTKKVGETFFPKRSLTIDDFLDLHHVGMIIEIAHEVLVVFFVKKSGTYKRDT